MGILETSRKQPQPFKTVWWSGLASVIPFAIGVLNQPASREGGMRLLFLPFPVILVVLGGVLALNINGNAAALHELSRQSRSPMASLAFVRLVGAGAAVVGTVMAVTFALGKG